MGAFIEECYRKRFGGDANGADPYVPKPRSSTHSPSQTEALASKGLGNAERQLSDLVCHLVNLADDLKKWLAHDTVDRDILTQVGDELRRSHRRSTPEPRFHHCRRFRFRRVPGVLRAGVRTIWSLRSMTRSPSELLENHSPAQMLPTAAQCVSQSISIGGRAPSAASPVLPTACL